MTGLEREILQQLLAEGGSSKSLLRISGVLGVSYYWAWVLVGRLEKQGVLEIKRYPGLPLQFRVCPEIAKILSDSCAMTSDHVEYRRRRALRLHLTSRIPQGGKA